MEEDLNGHADAAPTADRLRFSVNLKSHEQIELDLSEMDGTQGFMDAILEVLRTAAEVEPKFYVRIVAHAWESGYKELAIGFAEQGVRDCTSAGVMQKGITLYAMLATYNLSLARTAPKNILQDFIFTDLTKEQPKEHYFSKALQALIAAEGIDKDNLQVLEARASIMIASVKFDDAMTAAEKIVSIEPTNIIGNMTKARVHIFRKQHRVALKIYQTILRLSPTCLPDPRIGVGICFWHLGDQATAQKAWLRSIAVHGAPKAMPAYVLLGLSMLNQTKTMADADEAGETYRKAIGYLQLAFKSCKTVASTAAALSNHFLARKDWTSVGKLAERALQYADTKAMTAEAHYALARSYHGQDNLGSALPKYVLAIKAQPNFIPAALASAHVLVKSGALPEAVNAYENALNKAPQCIEILIGLAAVHAHNAYVATSDKDSVIEQDKAREKYEAVLRMLQSINQPDFQAPAGSSIRRIQAAGQDSALYIDVARLWAATDPKRTLKAYQASMAVRTDAEEDVPAALLNNMGCLEYGRKNVTEAQSHFEEAIKAATRDQNISGDQEAALVTALYNLAIAKEGTGQTEEAVGIYKGAVLAKHPEWFEAKARLGLIYVKSKNFDAANEIFKEALSSAQANVELRSLYTYYLIQAKQEVEARKFAEHTLKDTGKRDTYAYCAYGILLYNAAREIRVASPEQAKDKASKSVRAADFFVAALQMDPTCAVAAQGLAIILAEGALQQGPLQNASSVQNRQRDSREALSILIKIRDTSVDGSTYVNLGHVHSGRDEWEKAIENYETASKRYYHGKNGPLLLYLSRSWYQKASKDQSFSAVKTALQYAREALLLSPKDDGCRFNIAIIGHKGLEIIAELAPNRRSLVQIREAIETANESQEIFTALAAKPQGTTYSVDIAQQRVRYGVGLVSRANGEVTQTQEQYEASAQAKLDQAKADREADRQRIRDQENARLEGIRLNNERLAEERRIMQEEASSWYSKKILSDSDDEDGKKKRKGRKKKAADGDDFVAADGQVEEKPKKAPKRKNPGGRSKKEKAATAAADGEDKPAPTAQDDSAGEEEARPAKKSRKQFKSAEFIEDSD